MTAHFDRQKHIWPITWDKMQKSLQCAKTAVKFRKKHKMQKLEEDMEQMQIDKKQG